MPPGTAARFLQGTMDDDAFERERAAFLEHVPARRRAEDTRPFIVKHRPEKLQDVVGHEAVLARLSVFVQSHKVPHLLFQGPPGVGKTTCGTCLANEVLGEHRKRGFLWLNASDDRTAKFVSTSLKEFLNKVITLPAGSRRIVFLDEVDSMTRDAQTKLARLMDAPTGAATFVLACNDLAKVDDRVQARCAHFAFGAVPPAALAREIRRVAAAEKVALDESGLAAIVRLTGGDVRKGLNALQTCAAMGSSPGGAALGPASGAQVRVPLDGAAVCRLCDVPDADALHAVVGLCARGDAFGAVAVADALVTAGHSVHDVLRTLHDVLRPDASGRPTLAPAVRYQAFVHVSEALGRGKQASGAVFNEAGSAVHVHTPAQLRACVARICTVLAPLVGGSTGPFARLAQHGGAGSGGAGSGGAGSGGAGSGGAGSGGAGSGGAAR